MLYPQQLLPSAYTLGRGFLAIGAECFQRMVWVVLSVGRELNVDLFSSFKDCGSININPIQALLFHFGGFEWNISF
jgi:hypothetical protein